jgi:hypothetical protein
MIATTFHDALDPLTGRRVSLRFDRNGIVDRAESLAGGSGRNIAADKLWVLPALYDADATFPLLATGVRPTDVAACLSGGVAQVNVSVYCHDLERIDLVDLIEELDQSVLPSFVPILAVHPDSDAHDASGWLRRHVEHLDDRVPRVCKLFSYGDRFWDMLDTVFELGLLPIVYCRDDADIEAVSKRARGAVHFRHAVRPEQIDSMRTLPGATLQTSAHYLVPIERDVRERLRVLPPMVDDAERQLLADRVMSDVDIIVSDHNAPPLSPTTGPGLRVIQDFLPALLTAVDTYGWDLAATLRKATSAPVQRFERSAPDAVLVVDPADHEVSRWPGQSDDRAPYARRRLRGSVIAVAGSRAGVIV